MNPEDGKHDIGPVLESYGATIPFGGGWRRLCCPFHPDSSPSASVNYELSSFKCFVCDIFGDVYDVIQWHEGIGFREAEQRAAELAGERGEGSGSEPDPGSFLPARPRNHRGSGKGKSSGSSGPYGSIYG